MNRLRDYTRLIRMYGGALQGEENMLNLAELEEYKNKLLEFVPSINMTARGSPAFSSKQLSLLNPELAKNTAAAFTKDDDLDAPYSVGSRSSLTPKVKAVLNLWNEVRYGYSVATDLPTVQNWILTKLVEVLERIESLSAAPASTLPPPPKGVRVGPPRKTPVSGFEQQLIKWLKGETGATEPTDGEYDRHWNTVDVQTLEDYNALTDKGKVGTLMTKLETRFDANSAGNEAFGMQLEILFTHT
jgi:hypothetical protein